MSGWVPEWVSGCMIEWVSGWVSALSPMCRLLEQDERAGDMFYPGPPRGYWDRRKPATGMICPTLRQVAKARLYWSEL